MIDNGASASGRDRLFESLWRDAKREVEKNLQKAQEDADKLIEDSGLFREREMALCAEKARDEAMPQVSRILNHFLETSATLLRPSPMLYS